jgi:NhaP-type Na+/H+ or K+/H+ antiporter
MVIMITIIVQIFWFKLFTKHVQIINKHVA